MKESNEPLFSLEAPAGKAEELLAIVALSDEKKIDIMLSLMNVYHGNIMAWTTLCYQVVMWSIGISFAVVAYLFLDPDKAPLLVRSVIALALLSFGLMIHLFLLKARRAHYGNRLAIAKCEAGLGLYQKGEYLGYRPFFIYSTKMLRSGNLEFLIHFHKAATLVSAGAVWAGGLLA